MSPPERAPILVWDLPVRIVHWTLALLFAFQLVTGYLGGDLMPWHGLSGYCILVLVVFRVLWGFAGTRYARFTQFLAGPAEVLRFLPRLGSREPLPYLGHNPLAGWMVVALLVSLLAQAGSGLFANDGADFAGPLASLVTLETSAAFSQFHRANVTLLFVLVCVHLGAAAYHALVRREGVIRAMFTGTKPAALAEAMGAAPANPWRVALLLALAMFFVYVVVGAGR
jgi:cytochrome b